MITDQCPGCETRVAGPRFVVEDLIAYHRRRCDQYRHWYREQEMQIAMARAREN